jgi:predicted CopG family antitoxin
MVKVVSLSNEAYFRLNALKGDKSFSELVLEIIDKKRKNKKSLNDFFGIWAGRDKEIDTIKKLIEEDRKNFRLKGVKL